MLPQDKHQSMMGAVSFPVFKFASLDSTNIYLKNHLFQYSNYSVIVAENQSSGKGRFERKWCSVSGRSLTFSIKIPLNSIPVHCWSNTTQIMALSVAVFLEEFGLKTKIRWPNDIIIGDSKICGILAEAVPSESESWMILGVGININENESDFSGLDRAATSLLIETGRTFQIEFVLNELLKIFKEYFTRFVQSGFTEFYDMISERLYKPMSTVQVLQGNNRFEGRVCGINEQGAVLIQTDTGIVEVFSGEITSHAGLNFVNN